MLIALIIHCRKKREEEEKRKEEERLEIERLERIKLKKEKKEKERLEKERLKREEEEAKKEEELKKQSEEILKRILPDRQKDEQKAIEGGPVAGVANLQEAPAPDAKDPEGTPSASARLQDSSSSDRTNSEEPAKEEQIVSAGESVFITEKSVSVIEESSLSSEGADLLMGDEVKGHQRSIEVLDSTVHDGGLGNTSQSQNEASRGNLDVELHEKGKGEMHLRTDQTSSTSKDRFEGRRSNVGNSGGSEIRGLDTLGSLELRVSGKEIQSTVRAEEDQSNTILRRSKVAEDIASATLPATSTDQNVTRPKDAEVDRSNVANSDLKDERQRYSNNNSNSGNVTQKEQVKTEKETKSPSIETQKEEGSSEEMPNLMEHRPLVAELEQRRLQWIQDCISLT